MRARILVVTVTTLICASVAHAGVVDPSRCSVDSFLVACPAGDMVFHTVMREATGSPQNSPDETWLDLCGCAGVRWADPLPGDGYTLASGCRPTTLLTQPDARADFGLRAGGTCAHAAIGLLSGGVLVRVLTSLASPDQDGDLVVDAEDRALLAAKIAGPYDATADLNGDRALGPPDLEVLDAHLGHAAEMPTPARPVAWGRLKALYR